MRRVSGAAVAMILAIAVYFVLFWGFDALRILTSPTYGLEDVWRSQVIFGMGRYLGLDPMGLIKLAAAYGAVKLTVAGVCAVHLLDRARTAFFGGAANADILESGLLIAVAVSIASVAPAILTENGDLVRELTIQLILAALAAALCLLERSRAAKAEEAAASAPPEKIDLETIPAGAWFRPWRR